MKIDRRILGALLACAALAAGSPQARAQSIYQRSCVATAVKAGGLPSNFSFTTTANTPVTVAPANSYRLVITFQVPSTLTGGLWISGTNVAGNGTSGSFNIPAGTTAISFPSNTIGTAAITAYAAVGGVNVLVWEC